MYCNQCGAEIKDPSQKYCESCGIKLPTREVSDELQAASVATPSTSSQFRTGSLFDINRNYYILKEKYWDWGSGEILDENNQIIGRMRRVILSIRRRVELQEVDGTISATIHSKIVSARGAQDLKTPDGQMIARIKKKILSLFRPVFYLEAPDGTQWYRAQGKFMGWSYKVYDVSTGKVIAEIEKADKWRDIFLSGLLDFKDTYALKILDNETDRRILLGFVLSIDNILYDQSSHIVS
ncbi:MAG: hypothetical protein ACFFA6_11075 [Promethearchaeota archaeon]